MLWTRKSSTKIKLTVQSSRKVSSPSQPHPRSTKTHLMFLTRLMGPRVSLVIHREQTMTFPLLSLHRVGGRRLAASATGPHSKLLMIRAPAAFAGCHHPISSSPETTSTSPVPLIWHSSSVDTHQPAEPTCTTTFSSSSSHMSLSRNLFNQQQTAEISERKEQIWIF